MAEVYKLVIKGKAVEVDFNEVLEIAAQIDDIFVPIIEAQGWNVGFEGTDYELVSTTYDPGDIMHTRTPAKTAPKEPCKILKFKRKG